MAGPEIGADAAAERSDPSHRDVALESRLRQALMRLNRDLPRTCAKPTSAAEKLGLTDDEVAFYHALETNDSAVKGVR